MESCVIQLTPAAKKYGNLNIKPCGKDFFPKDVFGGPSRIAGIGVPIIIHVDGLSERVETDIPKDKTGKPRWIFRKRKWVKNFVRFHELRSSDMITIDRLDKRTYRISPNNKRPKVIEKAISGKLYYKTNHGKI